VKKRISFGHFHSVAYLIKTQESVQTGEFMKNFGMVALAVFLLGGCASSTMKQANAIESGASRAPASTSGDVSLQGKRASDMMSLIEKVGAVIPGSNDCGAGTCGEEAQLAIQCKYPNGPNPKHQMSCDVSGVGSGKKSSTLNGLKARQLAGLMDALKATEDEADPCTAGSCYEEGKLAVTCTFRNGTGGNKRCDVTALKSGAAGAKFPQCSGADDHGSCQDWQDCCEKNYPGQNECVPGRCG
jgi:hypothetical protein